MGAVRLQPRAPVELLAPDTTLGREGRVPPVRACWRELDPWVAPSGRAGALRLDANEGPPPPENLLAELLAEAMSTTSLYPEYEDLRRAAANAFGVTPGMVLPCNGADEGIRLVIQAYCGPADPLLITPPTFAMLGVYARLAEAPVLPAPLGPDWRLDANRVLDALPYASLVALVSPNNPTGLTISPDIVAWVLDAAGSRPVLLDETYAATCGQDAVPLLAGSANLLLLRTLSKTHGVPGLRCGFVLGDERVIRSLEPLRSPYNVSSVAAAVGAGLLRRDTGVTARLAVAVDARRRLATTLAAAGIEVVPSDTHFCMVRLGARRDAAVAALARMGILVRAIESLPEYIRVSVTSIADTDAFLSAFMPLGRSRGDAS